MRHAQALAQIDRAIVQPDENAVSGAGGGEDVIHATIRSDQPTIAAIGGETQARIVATRGQHVTDDARMVFHARRQPREGDVRWCRVRRLDAHTVFRHDAVINDESHATTPIGIRRAASYPR